MTRNILIAGMAALFPLCGVIARETKAPETPIDIDARKASAANLESHIAQREARLAEWGKDIVDLDARIEKRVDELVKMLAGLRDSQESRNAVTRMKKEAIESLRNGIDLYVRKRKEVRELIRTGESSALGDLGKLDQRIITRVDQIAELTKSIPTHQDVEKYESDGSGGYWNGYYYESSRITGEWKQNRRDTNASDQVRKQTSASIEEAIARLDQRRRSLKDLLANRQLNDSAKELYHTELGQIDAYEDHLQAQLRDVNAGSSDGGQEVGRDQAHDVGNLITDARKDLREDVARLFNSYDQFIKGRAYLEGLRQNLAARKEWLEKNAKP
jgi:hypothetical protein